MKALDLLTFQFGNRRAIERGASSCWTLLIGAILVGTAVLARNYDGVSLLDRPQFIWRPFLMSLVSSFVIFWFAYGPLGLGVIEGESDPLENDEIPSFWAQYFSFLGVFWLTAPIAWLYAIPVEHWWSPLEATKWNVGMLALVSVWRVILISRVLSVLSGRNVVFCLLLVLCPAMVEAFLAVGFFQVDMVGAMGGVRLLDSPERQFMNDVREIVSEVSCLGTVAAVTMFGTLLINGEFKSKRKKAPRNLPRLKFTSPPRFAVSLSLISLAAWLTLAWVSFPPLRNLAKMETLVWSGQSEEALVFLESVGPEGFPPNQRIPPDPWVGRGSSLIEMVEALQADTPDWIVQLYQNHVSIFLGRFSGNTNRRGEAIVGHLLEVVLKHPTGEDFVRETQDLWKKVARGADFKHLPERLESIGIEVPPPETQDPPILPRDSFR